MCSNDGNVMQYIVIVKKQLFSSRNVLVFSAMWLWMNLIILLCLCARCTFPLVNDLVCFEKIRNLSLKGFFLSASPDETHSFEFLFHHRKKRVILYSIQALIDGKYILKPTIESLFIIFLKSADTLVSACGQGKTKKPIRLKYLQ